LGFSTGLGSLFFFPPHKRQHKSNKQSKSPKRIKGINHQGIPAFCSLFVPATGATLTTGATALTGVTGMETGLIVVCSTAIGSTVTAAGAGIMAAAAPQSHFLKET